MGDTGLLLVPGCIWLPTSPFYSFSDLWIPTLYSIIGYRQLLYCVLEAHTHSPVRRTHFPLSNGTCEVWQRVNLTDWKFQSETLLLNEVTGWMLYEQSTLTKDLRCLSYSQLVHLCSCPSHLCHISIFCSLATLFCPSLFYHLHLVSITGWTADQGWKKVQM